MLIGRNLYHEEKYYLVSAFFLAVAVIAFTFMSPPKLKRQIDKPITA